MQLKIFYAVENIKVDTHLNLSMQKMILEFFRSKNVALDLL